MSFSLAIINQWKESPFWLPNLNFIIKYFGHGLFPFSFQSIFFQIHVINDYQNYLYRAKLPIHLSEIESILGVDNRTWRPSTDSTLVLTRNCYRLRWLIVFYRLQFFIVFYRLRWLIVFYRLQFFIVFYRLRWLIVFLPGKIRLRWGCPRRRAWCKTRLAQTWKYNNVFLSFFPFSFFR